MITDLMEHEILFDDVALIEKSYRTSYLRLNAENISPDCNCSGYTEINNDEEFSAA